MTKTYLHKKTGLTATLYEQNKMYYSISLNDAIHFVLAQLVEDSSDWVEILPKSEYPKIISFKSVITPTDDNIAVLDEKSGMYLYKSGVGGCLEDMLSSDFTLLIWQVATTPTDIFTVGDVIQHKDSPLLKGEITKINLVDGLLFFTTTCCNSIRGALCTNAIKVKKPIFVSEDGANMFEGDTCYVCPSLKNLPNVALNKCLKSRVVSTVDISINGNYLFFADRKTAVYYLFENKATFSVQDIRKAGRDLALMPTLTDILITRLRNEYDKIA